MFLTKMYINNSWEFEKPYSTPGEARKDAREILTKQHVKSLGNKSWFEIFNPAGVLIYKSTLSGYRSRFLIDFMGIKNI